MKVILIKRKSFNYCIANKNRITNVETGNPNMPTINIQIDIKQYFFLYLKSVVFLKMLCSKME